MQSRFPSRMPPFRVMGPHERGRFAPEAWGHLLALRGAGVLTPVDFEYVIDRAMAHLDGRIALDDVRALLDGAGIGDPADEHSNRVH